MLQVESVTFGYDAREVFEEVSFQVPEGAHIAVMGESGCGKSTLLRLLHGELPFEQGKIRWKDQAVKGPAYQLLPGGPFVKYLAQDFDLMPFISVEENVRKFLSLNNPERADARAEELLETMELQAVRDRHVRYLSGGQQQRVALARVLAKPPELLLLDEPFSHIDQFRRNALRRKLFRYLKKEGITVLYATHDAQDVLPFADQVMVLQDGEILDFRETRALYEQPERFYTATLLGEANLIPIEILKSYASTTRKIIVYAHELKMSSKSGLQVRVQESFYMGAFYRVRASTDTGMDIYFNADSPPEPGSEVFLNASLETINKRLPI